MSPRQPHDWERDVNYLLGLLPEEERERVREQFLADDEAFDRLRDAENDLFDAYVRGQLSQPHRQAFEQTLMRQPDAPAKLQAAHAMAPSAPRRQRMAIWLMAAAAMIALGLYFVLLRLAPGEKAPVTVATVVQPFRLTAIARAGEVQRLKLTANSVEFTAEIPAGPRLGSYAVEVERQGVTVYSGNAAPEGGQLRWRVSNLAVGPHVARIGPAEQPLAFYEFIVER